MYSRLKYHDLAKTMPIAKDGKAVLSQKWHRDPEEKRICKVFIYLSDVDETSGPFTYAYKSTFRNKYGHLSPQKPPASTYPPDGYVEKNIPKEELREMTGKAGTMIFCDTSGLHKGGLATEKERIMYTAYYASWACKDATRYKLPSNWEEARQNLSPEQIFALERNQ